MSEQKNGKEMLTDLKLCRMKNGQKITKEFLRRKTKMNHTLLEVLSVWWIVVAIDLSVVYAFVRIVKNTEDSKV